MINKRVDILTTEDEARWHEVLQEAGVFDFHHLPAYHRLAELRSEGEACMVVFRAGDCLMLCPFLLRDTGIPFPTTSASGCLDATSVHGYPGPLASTASVSEDVRVEFANCVDDFLRSRGVVTAFTRLNPLLNQASLLPDPGEVADLGVTVSIDLTPPQEEQYRRFRKSHRYEIERLRRSGFTCREVGAEHLDDFLRIYTQTMLDLGADDFYLYDRSYFEFLMGEMRETVHLFVCFNDEEVACVGLFALCEGIIHYLLAGTDARYRKLAPMKLLLDTVRMWGNRLGAHTLHLGGGVGARRDGLYEFKMGFGGREHSYKAWRHVVNREIYRELCAQAHDIASCEIDGAFFPAYRHPVLNRILAASK